MVSKIDDLNNSSTEELMNIYNEQIPLTVKIDSYEDWIDHSDGTDWAEQTGPFC